jgi:hypothetical protein
MSSWWSAPAPFEEQALGVLLAESVDSGLT